MSTLALLFDILVLGESDGATHTMTLATVHVC